jgi:hypothetical protein
MCKFIPPTLVRFDHQRSLCGIDKLLSSYTAVRNGSVITTRADTPLWYKIHKRKCGGILLFNTSLNLVLCLDKRIQQLDMDDHQAKKDCIPFANIVEPELIKTCCIQSLKLDTYGKMLSRL